MKIELAFDRRVHPRDNIRYLIAKKLKGFRKYKTAKKYGTPINAMGDHLHCYLTLRCNYNCYFCVNKQFGIYNAPTIERTGNEWVTYLNKLYNLGELFLQGGEPFLHIDTVDIINNLHAFNITIFTNLPHHKMDEIKKIKPGDNNIIFKVSYHPLDDKRSINQFCVDYKKIPDGIKKAVHVIDIPEVSYSLSARAFQRYGIYLGREDVSLKTPYNIIGKDVNTKTVMCNSHMEIVAPNMTVYRCLGLMIRGINDYTKQLNKYDFTAGFERCDYYGICGQCSTAKEIATTKEVELNLLAEL